MEDTNYYANGTNDTNEYEFELVCIGIIRTHSYIGISLFNNR